MTTTITLHETADGWESSDGRHWVTASEADRAIRASAEPGVLVLEWEPTTRIGRMVASAIAHSAPTRVQAATPTGDPR